MACKSLRRGIEKKVMQINYPPPCKQVTHSARCSPMRSSAMDCFPRHQAATGLIYPALWLLARVGPAVLGTITYFHSKDTPQVNTFTTSPLYPTFYILYLFNCSFPPSNSLMLSLSSSVFPTVIKLGACRYAFMLACDSSAWDRF